MKKQRYSNEWNYQQNGPYDADGWESDADRTKPTRNWRSHLPGFGLGSLSGYQSEISGAQEAVANEQQSRVALVSRAPEAATILLGLLRQESPVPIVEGIGREGFFTLIPLVEQAGVTESDIHLEGVGYSDAWPLGSDDPVQTAGEHDLILYVSDDAAHWFDEDARWFSRLRATRVPILPVLCQQAGGESPDEQTLEALRRKLGIRPVIVRYTEGGQEDSQQLLGDLVARMLAIRPRLAIPLAQESPVFRRSIAARVIRTGALMTLLLGTEPIPLLDLPFHIALQWKVALQLAAIYGRPGLDYRSREMAGTVLFSLLVRQIAGQLIKLIPVVGWLLSGILSGLSTFLMGEALVRYYEEELHFSLPRPSLGDLGSRLAGKRLAMRQRAATWHGQVRYRRGKKSPPSPGEVSQEIPISDDVG